MEGNICYEKHCACYRRSRCWWQESRRMLGQGCFTDIAAAVVSPPVDVPPSHRVAVAATPAAVLRGWRGLRLRRDPDGHQDRHGPRVRDRDAYGQDAPSTSKEERTRTYTVYNRVPKPKRRPQTYTVMVPETAPRRLSTPSASRSRKPRLVNTPFRFPTPRTSSRSTP